MTLGPPNPTGTPAPELRDIVPPQAYHLPGNYVLLALAVAAAAALAYLAWKFLRRPKKAPPPLSPRELAAARLAELRRRAPEMAPRQFGAEVSMVLSAYIGAVFHLHPENQTSVEFLASMAENRIFSPIQHEALGEFLSQCDLLKFAQYDAAAEAKERLLSQAADFIDRAGSGAPPNLPHAEALAA